MLYYPKGVMQKQITKIAIFLLFLFICVLGHSQFTKFELRHISQNHGLPGVSGRQVFQDSKGLMWIGVESYGLAKYDGYHFELFSHTSKDSTTICGNVIEAFCEDDETNIWCGTHSGLSIYDRLTKNFHRVRDIKGNNIRALKKTENGNIWIATENGASLYSSLSNTFKHFLLEDEDKIAVTDIEISADKTVWFSTNKGLFRMLKDSSIVKVPIYNPKKKAEVTYIHELANFSDSVILIGAEMDLLEYNYYTHSVKHIAIIEAFSRGPISEITDIEIDKKGNAWISTTRYGISVYFPKTGVCQNYQPDKNNPKGIKHYAVRDIFVDKSGLVWIVMKFQGIQIFSYQSQIIEHYYAEGKGKNMLWSKDIISILSARDTTVWLGSSNGGIHFYDPVKKTITHKNCLAYPQLDNDRITALQQDRDGKIWIGTHDYLYVSDERFRNVKRLFKAEVIEIACDSSNTLWVGTTHGLYVYEKGKPVAFADYCGFSSELDKEYIKTISVTSNNDIWIGAVNNGLFLYNKDSKTLQHFKNDESDDMSISGNQIRAIYEDRNGHIWIGTKEEGLNLYNPSDSSFQNFTERDGLPINTLFGIVEDSLNNLWISTFQGICKFNTESHDIENYTKEYGLQNDIFEPNAIAVAHNGEMYFGGDNGFNCLDPYKLKVYKKSVPLIFTSIRVFDEQVFSDLVNSTVLKLDHNHNYISFDFSLLDYSTSFGKHYTYMLEGFDNSWIYTSDRHFASYTNLDPGKYTFHVIGQSKDGFVNNNDLRIYLIIDAPLWKKTWFQIIIVFAVLVLLYGMFMLRLHRVKQQNIKLEEIVKEKTFSLVQKHEEVILQKKELEEKTSLLELKTEELIINTNEIQNKTQELQSKTKELEFTNENLEKANITKNTLVSVIAHDLKNQFNPIIGLSSSLVQRAEQIGDRKLIKFLGLISNAATSSYSVLENLLSWYKSQKGRLVPNLSLVNIHKLFEDIKSIYDLAARQKDINIEIVCSESLYINTDREMLNAIVRNLVNNAINFTPENGAVKLMAFENGNNVDLMVMDTGQGMSEQQLALLFDFESLKKKKSVASGLGMQICKEFSEAINGKIGVSSELGKGSCFTISLKKS